MPKDESSKWDIDGTQHVYAISKTNVWNADKNVADDDHQNNTPALQGTTSMDCIHGRGNMASLTC